jgi:hypothetical protein
MILEHLHAGGEVLVELHHAGGRGEDDPGLPLIRGDHEHLRAFHPVAK